MSTDQIVVCAFGPLAVTKAAVRRARALVSPRGRVVVVPAVRAARDRGLGALGSLRTPDVTVLDTCGRAGVEAALDLCDSGPLLFVHDDVLVPRQTLERLVAAHAEGHPLVVPYSNDNGVATTIGGLPSAARAAGELRRVATDPRLVQRSALTARPCCLLGDAASLRPLVATGLATAATVFTQTRRPFTVAGRAVVAHDGSCGRRLAAPEGPDGRPLVVASMIVRDEAALLPDCLASLEGLVDRVEICDTGSSDDTVAIAEAAGAHVIRREWRHDFAWARNEVLERCRDAWYVLHIDADERVECADPERVRRHLATGVDDHRAFSIGITNVGDEGGATTDFRATRLFNPEGVRFVGTLHESPHDLSSGPLRGPALEGVALRHLGYRDDIVIGRDKGRRNVDISRTEYEAEPSPQAALNYARSLGFAGIDEDLQATLYEEALVAADLNTSGRAWIMGSLAEIAMQRGDAAQALQRAGEALELVPADDRAATVYARAAEALGQPRLVLDMAARRRDRASAAQAITSSHQRTMARSREVAAHALLGEVDAALELALEILDESPAGFDAWPELVAVVVAMRSAEAVSLLVPVALHEGGGACLAAVVRALPPERTAEFCLRYCEAGGTEEEAVRVGLVAALLRDRADLFEGLLPYAERLDPETLQRIAARATARGDGEAAARLRAMGAADETVTALRSPTVDAADPLSRLRQLEQLRAGA